MENKSLEELLKISRNKISRGDSLTSVYKFLKNNNADEEATNHIISIINEDKKAIEKLNAFSKKQQKKNSLLINGIIRLIAGLLILVISWILLDSWLEVGRVHILPVIGMIAGGIIGIIGLVAIIIYMYRQLSK